MSDGALQSGVADSPHRPGWGSTLMDDVGSAITDNVDNRQRWSSLGLGLEMVAISARYRHGTDYGFVRHRYELPSTPTTACLLERRALPRSSLRECSQTSFRQGVSGERSIRGRRCSRGRALRPGGSAQTPSRQDENFPRSVATSQDLSTSHPLPTEERVAPNGARRPSVRRDVRGGR